MNDLTTFQKELPEMWVRLDEDKRGILEAHLSIKSFEDLQRGDLDGSGLATTTYRSYMVAVKSFYTFTEGMTPFQVRPNDIEGWYDSMSALDRNTRYGRVRGLKKFFEGIERMHPSFISPFCPKYMSEKLRHKLNRRKKGNRTKSALSMNEIKALLAWLDTDETNMGLCNRAIVYMLVTSGLRSAELLQLHWKDLEYHEGTWKAYFTGKGGLDAEQELYTPAVEYCRDYFKAVHHRQPQPGDALFWTVPAYKGDIPRPLTYHTLWRRVTEIGELAKSSGIIKRDIPITPHLFRRSYATLLYRSGMKIKAIQEKTRHASVETLMKHYVSDEEPATPYLQEALA